MNPNAYIGIPFVEKGREINGCDCWGLVRLVYKKELGIELPSYLDAYECTGDSKEISEKIARESLKAWVQIPAGAVEPYDVILLRMLGLPMHVGIVTRKGKMLHVVEKETSANVSYESISWKSKIMGFYRYACT